MVSDAERRARPSPGRRRSVAGRTLLAAARPAHHLRRRRPGRALRRGRGPRRPRRRPALSRDAVDGAARRRRLPVFVHRPRLQPAGGGRRLRRGGPASRRRLRRPRAARPQASAARGRAGRGPVVVRAGAALALPVLARRVADAGWSGLSWAVGVPGSVGGAVRMNAGGHGSDMASCLVRYTLGRPPRRRRRHRRRRPPRLRLPLVVGDGRPSSCWRPTSRSRRDRRKRSRPRWPPSSDGGASTSPAGPTPARCSPTPRVTRRDG